MKLGNLKNNWQRISLRHRIMVIIAGVLALLVFIRFIDVSSLVQMQIPMVSAVDREQKAVASLKDKLETAYQKENQDREKINRLRNKLFPYLWHMEGRNPASVIQSGLQEQAAQHNVTIQDISSPRTNEVTEHIHSAHISVRITSNMREITRFLTAIEKNERPFYWENCNIRPESPGKSNKVQLSGRIKIMYLTPEAEDIIFQTGDEGV